MKNKNFFGEVILSYKISLIIILLKVFIFCKMRYEINDTQLMEKEKSANKL